MKIFEKISILLFSSLVVSYFITYIILTTSAFSDDCRAGYVLILYTIIFVIVPFVLSLTAYLNQIKKIRSNLYLSFLSFTFLPFSFTFLPLILNYNENKEIIKLSMPYIICMIISYILFRLYLKKNINTKDYD